MQHATYNNTRHTSSTKYIDQRDTPKRFLVFKQPAKGIQLIAAIISERT